MPLREAHDIGEALEGAVESLEEVERAYVHLDWESDHKPERVRLPVSIDYIRFVYGMTACIA